MTLEKAAKHDCILNLTDDPQGRFLIINDYKKFYPILNGEFLIEGQLVFVLYYQISLPADGASFMCAGPNNSGEVEVLSISQ